MQIWGGSLLLGHTVHIMQINNVGGGGAEVATGKYEKWRCRKKIKIKLHQKRIEMPLNPVLFGYKPKKFRFPGPSHLGMLRKRMYHKGGGGMIDKHNIYPCE